MSEAADPEPRPWLDRTLERTARWLARRRIPLLVAAVLISAIAAVPASRLDLDQTIESFFSPTDPRLQAYQQSREAFGGDEFVLVAFEQEDPTYADSLNSLTEFSSQLSQVPGVRGESTQDLARTLRVSTAPVLKMLPRLVQFAARRAIRDRLIEFSRRLLIGEQGDVSAVILRLLPEEESPVSRAKTFREIRRIANAHQPPAYVAGEPIQVHDMFRYVDRDSRVLGVASTALMVLVILAMFRSLRWVLLPLAIVHATLLWTKAILYASGLQLSMVSSMLTSLLTIIGIATVTHITVLFRDYRRTLNREDAFCRVFVYASAPVFWVTVTTIVGFAALLVSDITPIRSFSWMMTIGTTLLLVTFPMILPGGILVGNFQAEPKPTGVERRVEGWLDAMTAWVGRRSKLVLGVTLLLALVSSVGLLRQRVETDFSKNFRASSPIVQSIRFFESRLGGVGSWEVGFEAPAELTTEFIDQVRTLSTKLAEIRLSDGTQLTKIMAITDGLDLIPPIIAEDWILKLDWLEKLQPEFVPSLYNPQQQRMRIILRALEQQPAERKLELIDRVEQTSREVFSDARATGLYVLLANLISSVLGDQLSSGLVSAAGIVLCILLAFRDWRIALISLAPNILPILLVVGGIGWADTPVNIGAAMVASVSLGLTVDASILYLTDYQRSRLRGASHEEAIRETHAGAGLAVVLASFALMAGFAVLTLSEFIPLVFFGALVSVAMAVGLVGNIVLLPIMLSWLPETTTQRKARERAAARGPEPAASDAS